MAIFIGFAAFFVMEKTLRVLGGEEGETGHSHSHSHSPVSNGEDASGHSSAVSPAASGENSLRSRAEKPEPETSIPANKSPVDVAKPSKLSAYLNLFGDFVHNM